MVIGGPLQAYAARRAAGAPVESEGYGPLLDMGDLSLPRGFRYRIISRSGEPMSNRNPTPTLFDGMALPGPRNTTVLVRNHENRRSTGDTGEIDMVVPPAKRYDANPIFNGGNTKLVVTPDRRVVREFRGARRHVDELRPPRGRPHARFACRVRAELTPRTRAGLSALGPPLLDETDSLRLAAPPRGSLLPRTICASDQRP